MIENCYKGCKHIFISLLNPPNNKYAWLEEPAEVPSWFTEKKANVEKDLDLKSMIEFKSVKELKIDFMIKLDKGEISCY